MKKNDIKKSNCKWFTTIMFTIFLGIFGIQNLYSRKTKKWLVLNFFLPIISCIIIFVSLIFYSDEWGNINATSVIFIVIGASIYLITAISILIDIFKLCNNTFCDAFDKLVDKNNF